MLILCADTDVQYLKMFPLLFRQLDAPYKGSYILCSKLLLLNILIYFHIHIWTRYAHYDHWPQGEQLVWATVAMFGVPVHVPMVKLAARKWKDNDLYFCDDFHIPVFTALFHMFLFFPLRQTFSIFSNLDKSETRNSTSLSLATSIPSFCLNQTKFPVSAGPYSGLLH